MNSFVNAIQEDPKIGTTFNGAVTFTDSGSKVLNLFKSVGQRGANLSKELDLAIAENKNLAMRTVLWSRDIRGGAGEREVFRNLLRHMEITWQDNLISILPLIPELGRWDDLLIFETDFFKKKAFELIKNAIENKNGLCAKWMPRQGKQAVELRKFLGYSPKQWRKILVNLTKVVESQMCAKNWDSIVFDHVPSVAAARYQKAFNKHTPEKYKKYRDGLVKIKEDGTTERKINTAAVFPYDVVKSLNNGDPAVANAQWKALPNFITGEFSRILPMVDLSVSMTNWSYYNQRKPIKIFVTPMDIAISIGLYVSEKQQGEFKGTWLNFSKLPKLRKFTGDLSLQNMYNQLDFNDWGGSTNIQAAFELILETARRNNVPQEEMPETLLILSDMEFDDAVSTRRFGLSKDYALAKENFKQYGYKLPKIVFWHINGRSDNNPVEMHQTGTAMVSGFSPAIFKSICSNNLENFTPYNVMLETLMNKKYDVEGLTI